MLSSWLLHSALGPDKTFTYRGHANCSGHIPPVPDLTSPTESRQGGHVFLNAVEPLKNIKPDYLAVAFDVSDSTTLRKGWYPEYKASRQVT